MKYCGLSILVFFWLVACRSDLPEPLEFEEETRREWFASADLSFLPKIRQEAYQFKNSQGEAVEILSYLKESGINLVRVRVWHSPSNEHSSLAEVLDLAKEIKAAGMDLYLDFHYSDTWTDLRHQAIPEAWSSLGFSELNQAIHDYTKSVLQDLADQNTSPVVVQIGNETNAGFLWNMGRVGGNHDDNWDNYRTLVGSAIEAVREVNPEIQVMLHHAGTTNGADWYFGNMTEVDYDIIGLSYYPGFHGQSLLNLGNTMNSLSAKYDRKMMIAETAYPFTLAGNDRTNNIWGPDEYLLEGHDASEAGQESFLKDLISVVASVPRNRGIGISYWAPEFVAFRGDEAPNGSPWENMALFDFDGKALDGLGALGSHPE